ncbi:MAG: nitronate monooxygenase [Deltaproteobacteria bacterium]|nr:nitronate monooxygenase [Deltaproteobacteria bacterium]
MGVAVSSWRLARAVASLGHLGVVSGVGIGNVLSIRLWHGEQNVLRVLRTFPDRTAAREIEERYYRAPGGNEGKRPPLPEMWSLDPTPKNQRLTVVGAFVEVTLAREGHGNAVGINLLEKIALPSLATLYGAMLAGVDTVIMGAGIPLRIPGALDLLARHQRATYPIYVDGADKNDDYKIAFDPAAVFPEWQHRPALVRPRFFPIVSSNALALAMVKRADGSIEGFVVEAPTAGGHNAPPRGNVELNADGEPIYGPRDEVDLDKLKALGLPFWLAGKRGTPEGLRQAQALGAAGIQVGTAFAFCRESGIDPDLRRRIVADARAGHLRVRTDARASPTGFPFKVVQVAGTISDGAVRDARERVCNIGVLREAYKRPDGTVGYRCASEPVDQFVAKGGKLEDTVGRACLCNGLTATVGLALPTRSGALEPPIVTAGDDLVEVARYLGPGQDDYGAADVVAYLLGQEAHERIAPAARAVEAAE